MHAPAPFPSAHHARPPSPPIHHHDPPTHHTHTPPTHPLLLGSVILEERIDAAHPPSAAEVEDYARWLGMDPRGADRELLWVAREGLMAALPPQWKACLAPGEGEAIYYFNFATGGSRVQGVNWMAGSRRRAG